MREPVEIHPINEKMRLLPESDQEQVNLEKMEEALNIRDQLIALLEKYENNTNTSIAWLVPVNTSTSIFPEFVSPLERLSASTASALTASLANSFVSAWENCSKNNTGLQKGCSFKAVIDFLKSPIGAPVFTYSMLLCFKTLGDFAPQLPDNAPMLSLISAIFAVSLLNGVLAHLGAKSEVNPHLGVTRKDVAQGMIAGVTAAGFIAQIDRMLKMNMDPETYETFGPYILPVEAAVGLIYGLGRTFLPALLRYRAEQSTSSLEQSNESIDAVAMMNKIKSNWDEVNKHVRFAGNLIYICGLAIEAKKLVDPVAAAGIISAVIAGPVAATTVHALTKHCCSSSPRVSGLLVNSPVFGQSEPVLDKTEEKAERQLGTLV